MGRSKVLALLIGLPLILDVLAVFQVWWRVSTEPAAVMIVNGSLSLGPMRAAEEAIVLALLTCALGYTLAVLERGKHRWRQTLILTAAGAGLDVCVFGFVREPSMGWLLGAIGIAFVATTVAGLVKGERWWPALKEAKNRLRFLPVLLLGFFLPALVVLLLAKATTSFYFLPALIALFAVVLIQAWALRIAQNAEWFPATFGTWLPWRRWLVPLPLTLAMLAVPTLVTKAVSGTEIWLRDGYGSVLAVGWPSGRHPVIVYESHLLDCLDDHCEQVAMSRIPLSPNYNGTRVGYPSASIAADGAVTMVAGDELVHCPVNRDGCRSVFPAALAQAKLSAIAISTSGDVFIATAKAIEEQPTSAHVALAIVQCGGVQCAEAMTNPLGDVLTYQLQSSVRGFLTIAVDPAGHPVMMFPGKDKLWAGKCDGGRCQLTESLAEEPQQSELVWRASTTAGKDGYYGLGRNPNSLGSGADKRDYKPYANALLICADRLCADVKRRIPMPLAPEPNPGAQYGPRPEVFGHPVAVHSDGRVIIADNLLERILVIKP